MTTKTRTRKTPQEKLVLNAQTLVPKTGASILKLNGLLKLNPTAAQKKQIVETIRGYFEQFEQAYSTPEKTTAPGTFNLVS